MYCESYMLARDRFLSYRIFQPSSGARSERKELRGLCVVAGERSLGGGASCATASGERSLGRGASCAAARPVPKRTSRACVRSFAAFTRWLVSLAEARPARGIRGAQPGRTSVLRACVANYPSQPASTALGTAAKT
jgi:hypothetical protein